MQIDRSALREKIDAHIPIFCDMLSGEYSGEDLAECLARMRKIIEEKDPKVRVALDEDQQDAWAEIMDEAHVSMAQLEAELAGTPDVVRVAKHLAVLEGTKLYMMELVGI